MSEREATVSADLAQARHELVIYGRRMTAEGLVFGSDGNLSIRLGDQVLITPSGVEYALIEEDELCLVTAADGVQVGGGARPSSETPMHRAVYASSDAGAVVHTHSTAAVAASTLCDELPAVHYAILRLGGSTIRVAPFRTFGSDGLADAAREALDGRCAALLQNHGVIAYGSTLAQAYARAKIVEWLSDVWLRARAAGSPRILTDEELAGVTAQSERLRYGGGQA